MMKLAATLFFIVALLQVGVAAQSGNVLRGFSAVLFAAAAGVLWQMRDDV